MIRKICIIGLILFLALLATLLNFKKTSGDYETETKANPPLEWAISTTTRPVPEWNEDTCSCVKYVRSLGVPLPYGIDAIFYKTFGTDVPKVGSVALFSYGPDVTQYHLGLVVGFDGNGFELKDRMLVKKSDGTLDCLTRDREIPWNYTPLIGFWTPPSL